MRKNVRLRSDTLNEKYYGEVANVPIYGQFRADKTHFIDTYGRIYMIAANNGQIFQNERVQFNRNDDDEERGNLTCITDNSGYIKLFVKIPIKRNNRRRNNERNNSNDDDDNRLSPHWFKYSEIDEQLTLRPYTSNNTIDDLPIRTVILRKTEKILRKRAVGVVYVEGLSESYCNKLLNK